MNTTYLSSKNSKTCDPHRLLLDLTDKMDLKSSDKYIFLSNLSKYYALKNKKCHIRTTNLKNQCQNEISNFNYLVDHIMY